MRQALVLTLALLAIAVAGCGGDSAGSGIAGTYTLDTDDFTATMEKMMLEQMGPMLDQLPPEKLEEMKAEMRANMGNATAELVVKDDGTYTMTAVMQSETNIDEGTWKQEGDVITFLQKTENGKPKEDAKPITVTQKDGNLSFKPDPDAPFEITMKRK